MKDKLRVLGDKVLRIERTTDEGLPQLLGGYQELREQPVGAGVRPLFWNHGRFKKERIDQLVSGPEGVVEGTVMVEVESGEFVEMVGVRISPEQQLTLSPDNLVTPPNVKVRRRFRITD